MRRRIFSRETWLRLLDYGLILLVIAIVVIGIVSMLGPKVSNGFTTVNSGLN